jgi:hypothetical protein
MDDWHRKLARDLVSETPAGPAQNGRDGERSAPDGAQLLEIAFGQARSAVTYVLELARAHRLPATGSVAGDDVWVQLGDAKARFTLNRREAHVVAVRPGKSEARFRYDKTKGALVDGDSVPAELGAVAREAIDAIVTAWRARPIRERVPSAPPPEFEDEPTKKG